MNKPQSYGTEYVSSKAKEVHLMSKWWIENGPRHEVALSSRVRLARNLEKYPFPGMNTAEKEVTDKIESAVSNSSIKFSRMNMDEMNSVDKQFLVEKHLISPALCEKPGASVFLSPDERISIMTGEEDHIRIQAMAPGFDLDSAFENANLIAEKTPQQMMDYLVERISYAFSDKFGYITSCLTNMGTGMRASVMMHLPALCITKEIGKIINSVSKFGIAVRGLYGEGSEASGNIFQISNQITLGISEAETISNLKSVAESIIERELEARTKLSDNNIISLADKVWRAYGILKNAQILSSDEFMKLSSYVRLGANMGIIGNINTESLNVTI